MLRSLVGLVSLLVAFDALAYRMSAWVPAWDGTAVTTLQQRAGELDEANPGWYGAAADGSVTKNWGAEDNQMRAALSGVELLPTIKNYGASGGFDGALAASLVDSPELREKHAEAIAQLVVQSALDGIDVDYERVPSSSRAGFTAFIEILGAKLRASGKRLSVTVHAKTSDVTWNGPGSQDWMAIGAAADTVKIMAYDYHWSTSGAGPIAPLSWLDAVASYAGQTIPAGKAIIGLPWYGYDWLNDRGEAVTYGQAIDRAAREKVSIGRDANGEATYTYGSRTVYFQDAESYRRKIEWLTARHPGIGGFAHWRVGAEDPAIWDVLSSLRRTGSTPVEQPRKDFAMYGPVEILLQAGSAAAASFGYTGINGFDETVAVTATVLDPFGGAARLSAATVAAGRETTLHVTAPRSAVPGVYRLGIRMSGSTAVREQVVLLRITAPPPAGRRRAVR